MSEAPLSCVEPFLKRLESVELSAKHYDDLRRVLKRAGVELPAYSGWFKVPNLRKGELPPHRKYDIVKLLTEMEAPRGGEQARMYRLGLELAVMVRALGNLDSHEVAEPLVRFTFQRAGIALRHEVSRALESLRGYAVAGLLELRSIKVRDWKQDRRRYLIQKFAEYMLTVLPEGDPRLALSRADRPLKLRLMKAYGRYRVAEAARALVDHTDSRDAEIRKAARSALARYFEGPRPRSVRRHLKLPGGEETRDRRLIYMNFRQRAIHEIRIELERLTGGNYERRQKPKKLMRLLFDTQDRKRAERKEKLFARAVLVWRQGKREQAMELFDEILAASSLGAERAGSDETGSDETPVGKVGFAARLAPFYRQYGVEAGLEGKLDQAASRLMMAAILERDDESRREVFADAIYASALAAEARKDLDTALTLHREALQIWPAHGGAQRAVVSLEGARLEPGHAGLLMAAGAAGGGGLLWLLGLLVGRLRRRKREDDSGSKAPPGKPGGGSR
jgi:tetratricopeptide (TPR) repeat protein